MKRKKLLSAALALAMAVTCVPASVGREVQAAVTQMERTELNFDTNWLYSSVDYLNGEEPCLDETDFEQVSVPHANQILDKHSAEDFEAQIGSYRFVSWYRRHFTLPQEYADRNIRVEFEGVATIAEVYVNGTYISTHEGAYTTFTVDITDYVYTDGRDNVLAVRVDSEKQVQIPPEGGNVDYCLFGGIVRDVSLIVTDPVYVERTFVTTPDLKNTIEINEATVNTQVDISNKLHQDKTYTIETTLLDADGQKVSSASKKAALTAGEETKVEVVMENIEDPHLWGTDDPYLYTVVTEIKDGDTVIDAYDTRIGMRYFWFGDGTDGDGSFYLNGEKIEIVGINRHEQWPWIGRAVPDKLQIQDADLIKASGINAVRCSHYPQDPSFMDRCDELGLLVFTEAPGWQHIGDDDWKQTFKNNLTELILRDRNHPSVISWSATPNESNVNTAFNTECHNLVKSLDPTRPTHGVRVEFDYPYGNGKEADTVVTDILTVNYTYQNDPNHNPPHIPYVITEHSNDWWGDGRPDANDTQALKFIDSFAEVLDAYFANDKVVGGFGWSMFDYNNEVNYTNSQHVFYSGLYDLWREEKPAAYVYKSQQQIEDAGAIVYIANNWTEDTSGTVYVLSNCDEIELFVNDVSQGKIKPNKYTNLPHPIYQFTDIEYEEGELKAVGYVAGQVVEECVRVTPGEAVALVAEADYTTLTADGTDMTSIMVRAVDANGNEVPFAANTINVTQIGGVETTLIAEENVALEGGHISFLVQSKYGKTGTAKFEVVSDGLKAAVCEIEIEPFVADDLVPVSQGTQAIETELPQQFSINDTKSGNRLYDFQYEGSGWQYGTETTAYDSDNHWSDVKNDTVSIRFKGTNIKYYGAKAAAHGIAAFSLDGGEEVMVDCYSASRVGSAVLFEATGLAEGEHILTVRVTGEKNTKATGTYVNADRVLIETGTVVETTVVNDREVGSGMGQIQYSEGWTKGTSSGSYEGDDTWTNVAGKTMTFRFTGAYLRYIATKDSHQGIAAFSIDGGEEVMVDFYQAQREDQVLLYEAADLDYGEHTLTVRVTGEKNIASTDSYVVVDKIEVYSQDPDRIDRSELQDLITEGIKLQEQEYTTDSWNVWTNALEEGKKVLSDKNADQTAVNLAVKRLQSAKIRLVEKEESKDPELPYVDVSADDWFYDAAAYTYRYGIMTGIDKEHFGTYEPLSRAQFALILYRMQGEPEITFTAKNYQDVVGDEWYGEAVLWASGAGVVSGYENGCFGPADLITREQMAVMMYRYAKAFAGENGTATALDGFKDAKTVSPFAEEAMKWAVAKKVISGKENGTLLDPQGTTSRAEAAVMITRFLDKF